METRTRKRLLLIGGAVAVALVAAILILASQANRILERELRKALGENFAVESLVLGWNRIEANGPRLMQDGRVTAQARRIVLRPEFLSLLKSGLSVASVVIEEPFLAVEIDERGQWVSPALPGEKPAAASASAPGPVSVGRVEIRQGALTLVDRRRPEPNRVELRKIDLVLEGLAYPLRDAPSAFDVRVEIADGPVTGSASGSGTVQFGTLALNGRFEGRGLALPGTAGGEPAARVEAVRFAAASEGAQGPLTLSDLVLVKPALRVQTDRQGKVVSPLPAAAPEPQKGKAKEGEDAKASLPVVVKNLRVEGGDLLYLDGKVSRPPHPVRVTDIEMTADRLAFPADGSNTAWRLSARLPGPRGTGVLNASGTTALKTLDTGAAGSLRGLDLTAVKPYLLKKGDVDISRGFLDMDVDLAIRNRMLKAPVRSVLRDLQFPAGKGLADRFLGVPRSLVISALETGNNRIELDFVVEGSLDNPRFSLQESMVSRLAVGLAKRLGLGVVETGESLIVPGGRVLKGVGDAMKRLLK
ncbi:MAG: DUF748 domain-containing protein [Syntrophaceae bacterium]|nr:DUF748 domain-containing protein [Syntrophaceae bacterium]